jgi:fido (protein-threonine AMPylation protein)
MTSADAPEPMVKSHDGIFGQSGRPDADLEARCLQVLSRLRACSDADALAALADPREIHRTLYCDLAPEDCPEAAGNFRGSEYPALKNSVVLFSFNSTEGTTNIAWPQHVHELMQQYADFVRKIDLGEAKAIENKLEFIARLMIFLGYTHPFIDGNGHIQRITAQCLIERAGFKMTSAWRIHPCPYGEQTHRALAAHDTSVVAEMLGRFVG